MYGRGVDDDKGHITARLSALRKYMQHHDDLPVNISFIMEGAEESASTDLDKYLENMQTNSVGRICWSGNKGPKCLGTAGNFWWQ